MDISIPDPSKPASSQTLMKRQKKQEKGVKNHSKRRKVDRCFEPIECEDSYNTNLSQKTRDTVLKLRKISDPFDQELQTVVDDVFDHFEEIGEGDFDLAEAALLLSSVTQVYSSQVKTLHEQVLATANRLSGKEEKSRQRRKGEKEEVGESKYETKESKEELVESGTCQGSEFVQAVGDCVGDSINSDESAGGANPEVSIEAKEAPVVGSTESEELRDKPPVETNVGEGEEAQKEETKEEVEKLETEILQEIPSRCTRRQSERLKTILNIEKGIDKERNYTGKKRKFDDDPPTLISAITEWNGILEFNKLHGDVDYDDILPPVLEVQVGRRRKKLALNNNEVGDDDGACEACHKDTEADKTMEIAETKDLREKGQYETLDHLPNDVQERFHGLIQEMYKLPFDYSLVQKDMFAVYQQKFMQAVSLLSQNSVLVKKGAELEGMPQPVVKRSESQASESDATISSIAELLNQVRHQAAEEYNKGKQSKSDAEVPVSQMIATLKRIICKRYKKWHARTDCDREVFNRIKEFEDKVKTVLKRETEQGLFDVKKYEMEVMDVTLKESVDGEREPDDILLPPLSPLPLARGGQSPNIDDLMSWAGHDASRRSSIVDSIDGSCSSWIKLNDIFSHMKKINNSETCRHFYAVLGLLSHKNLNINYDNFFSQESAKLITKVLKKSKHTPDPNSMSKYPVGAKIMTSRCPDSNEVLLAPVFSSETIRQILEQDGYLSSSGYQSDGQGSSSSTPAPNSMSQSKSIQDAISEFVVDEGEQLPDDYFSKSRRKRN